MTEPTVPSPSIEPLKLFNEFQAQLRARLEASLKLIMILSGGMLTLSVGAVLGSSPPRIPAHLIRALSWSWVLLFFSIAAATVVMAGMIAATAHMGFQWRKRMQSGEAPSTFFVAAWKWLRIANVSIGVLALLSFLAGLVLISQVAIGVAAFGGNPVVRKGGRGEVGERGARRDEGVGCGEFTGLAPSVSGRRLPNHSRPHRNRAGEGD